MKKQLSFLLLIFASSLQGSLLDTQEEQVNSPAVIWSLHSAIKQRSVALCYQLLQEGTDPNTRYDGWTPLHYVAFVGYAEFIPVLIEYGASVDAYIYGVPYDVFYEFTPLLISIARGHQHIVELLLTCGALPNQQTRDRQVTPLSIALTYGKKTIAAYLLAKGASPTKTVAYRTPPLVVAASYPHNESSKALCELLLRADAHVDDANEALTTALHAAASRGDTPTVKLLLFHQANPLLRDVLKLTPLYYSLINSHAATSHMLLSHIIATKIPPDAFKNSAQRLKAALLTLKRYKVIRPLQYYLLFHFESTLQKDLVLVLLTQMARGKPIPERFVTFTAQETLTPAPLNDLGKGIERTNLMWLINKHLSLAQAYGTSDSSSPAYYGE